MTDARSLEVIIQLEQNDLSRAGVDIAFDRLTLYRWVTVGVGSGMFSAMLAYLVFHSIDSVDLQTAVLIAGLLGVLFLPSVMIAAIYINSGRAARSLLQNTPSLRGPTRWTFSENGVETEGPTARAELRWATFTRVLETKQQYLLFPQDTQAWVIPKRCFQSEMEIARMRELARRLVPAAKLRSSEEHGP